MNRKFIKILYAIFLLVIASYSIKIEASTGTIDPSFHTAQLCEDVSCTVSSTSAINFGNFTTANASNITISDTALTGYMWGKSFGWVVLNCNNTTSGCSSTNGNFKVANTTSGHLSGYGWGETSGWVNFGPFSNTNTSSVVINSSGELNGYAWAQNYGWIKFDCSLSQYCVKTTWRPTGSSSGGGGGGGGVCQDPRATNYNETGTCEYPQALCLDHTALNYNSPLPCSYDTVTMCLDHNATNYNQPLPCQYPLNLCNDRSATNFGGALPCTYPASLLCLDHFATNYGNSLPCNYPSNICNDSSATNFGSTLPCQYPSGGSICLDKTAENYNGSLPCKYPQSSCPNGNCGPVDKVKIINFLGNVTHSAPVKVITVGGAVVGVFSTLMNALFSAPINFSEISFIPIRLWNLIAAFFGLKRKRPWGVVYDSITKQPLDPCYVILQDMNGKEVATSITDIDGRYGFLVPPGKYKIIARKTDYTFPSQKLFGKVDDELYQDLYFGEPIEIGEGIVIAKNIPMDPIKFNWNEFIKKKKNLTKFFLERNIWIARISNILFFVGFISTCVSLFLEISKYNIIVMTIYILLFLSKFTILKPRAFGVVTDKTTGSPFPFAIMRIAHTDTEHEFAHKVTNLTGKYFCIVPNGTYKVKIDKKNDDESYSSVHTSEPIEVKNGHINKKFEI